MINTKVTIIIKLYDNTALQTLHPLLLTHGLEQFWEFQSQTRQPVCPSPTILLPQCH